MAEIGGFFVLFNNQERKGVPFYGRENRDEYKAMKYQREGKMETVYILLYC